jgi:anaerobic magnesium-protoporphyrin IX monomethyl ester cyclase
MKNFLLVVPQFVYAGEYYNFPLGLGYVSACLKKQGFNVFCLNLNHFEKKMPLSGVLQEHINRYKIDVFCTGTMSWYWDKLDEILKLSKQIKPDIINVVGGAIVISDPELALKNLDIDIAVIGEGEETMVELARAFCDNASFDDIKGLAFLRDGKMVMTPPRPYIEDLDTLPLPDHEGFEFSKWNTLVQNSGNIDAVDECDNLHYAEIVGSRSCPFSCTFCYHHLGQKYRQRSLVNLFAEIKYLNEKYQVNFLNFYDELFSANHQRMNEFAELIKNYNIFGWCGGFRVNNVNSEMLSTLKKSGVKYIGYGIENINDEILASMNKKITVAEIENALKLTREAGIVSSGNLIFGDPAETEETVKNSIRWWLNNPQYNISLVFLKLIPGSPVYQYALKNNFIPNKLKHIKERFPIINITKIPDRKFYKLYSQITWLKQTRAQIRPGKLISSKKVDSAESNNLYSLHVQCFFCAHTTKFDKLVHNSLYTYFYCEQCASQNKISSAKILGKNYHYVYPYYRYCKMFLFTYLLRFYLFRKYKTSLSHLLKKLKS